MDKVRTSRRLKGSSQNTKNKSFKIDELSPVKIKNGLKLAEHNPDVFLKNTKLIRDALSIAFFEGDVEAFKDILASHIRAVSKDEISKKTGISRATIFRMLDHESNPSFENVLKVVRTLKIA